MYFETGINIDCGVRVKKDSAEEHVHLMVKVAEYLSVSANGKFDEI